MGRGRRDDYVGRAGRRGPPGARRRPARGERMVAGGAHAVEEAMAGPSELHCVYVDEGAPARAQQLARAAREAGLAVSTVPVDECDSMSGVRSGGVAAEITFVYREFRELLHELPDGAVGCGPLLLLDQITDPVNLGAVIRTAEAAGALAVVLPGRRAAPVTATVLRISAGAALHLPVCRVANLSRAIEMSQQAGFWAVGLDAEADDLLEPPPSPRPAALVLGSEGSGLRPLVARNCDQLARVPMRGRVASLYASAAAAVALYRVAEGLFPGRSSG